MTKVNDGGPAFPSTTPYAHPQVVTHAAHQSWPPTYSGSTSPTISYPGMSLRDWIAGQVLAGYCAVEAAWDETPEEIARCAYRTADALLSERSKAGGEQL